MKIRPTYLILMLTAFSFIVTSTMQSLASFTDLFNEQNIVLDLSTQEEENETSGQEELKEAKEQIEHQRSSHLFISSGLKFISYGFYSTFPVAEAFHEVITPPPELG